MKIKFKIDTDNPSGGKEETKYRFFPAPYEVRTFDESSLFAGKIHAIICRDYYDYLFYIAKGSKVNLTFLENKLNNSEILHQNEKLTLERVKFGAVDYELVKEDVLNFVDDKSDLNLWKKELFIATLVDLMTD